MNPKEIPKGMEDMELIRKTAPFDASATLKLLEDTFGIEEALLETPQLTGQEVSTNRDIVWEAWEDGRLIGTIHATIPLRCPHICGLSAMVTAPAARGKGLGRILFSKILEEIDKQGVTTAFLGTSNPVAAKLYHSLGFSFLPGSHVMVRYLEGDTVDFCREYYHSVWEGFDVLAETSAIRIPLIPLVVLGGTGKVLDVNTGIFHRDFMTQRSCMGLYPRYTKLLEEGGSFYAGVDNRGVLGAMLSTLPTETGIRADFFCCEGFESCLPRLFAACPTEVYLQIADCDEKKQQLAKQLGFRADSDSLMLPCGEVFLPFRIYRK